MTEPSNHHPPDALYDEFLDAALAGAFGDSSLLDASEILPRDQGSSEGNEASTKDRPHPSRAEPPEVAILGYEILRELGRGGMGVVYLARQVELKRLVALKMLLGGAHAGEEAKRRFRREAEAVARLQHPHIVQIHEIGEAGGFPYFSLEYVAGGSLDSHLDGTPWPALRAAELVESLARTIEAAHQQQIIHRDLKPANVLMTEQGLAKITDFGLVKILDEAAEASESGAIVGTPSYMAPEQASTGTRQVSPLTDLYALGAVLYELLVGRPPFKAESAMDTMLQVVHTEPVPPARFQPNVQRDLETICLKCLEKDPGQRYASAGALAEDLRCFCEGKPISARPVGRLERLRRWCRRHPRQAGLTGGIALLLLAVVLGVFAFAVYVNQINRHRAAEAGKLRVARDAAEQHDRQSRHMLEKLYVANGTRLAEEGDLFEALHWLAKPLQKEHGEMIDEEMHRRRLAVYLRYSQMPKLVHVFPHSGKLQVVYRAGFNPDGRTLVTFLSRQMQIWDSRTGQALGPPLDLTVMTDTAFFSQDGRYLVINGVENGSHNAFLWNLETRTCVAQCKGQCQAISADGDKLVIVIETFNVNQLYLWDVATQKPSGAPQFFPVQIKHAEFGPDGLRVVTVSRQNEVQLWQAMPRQPLGEPFKCPEENILDVSADGRHVLARTGFAAQVWDGVTGKRIGKALRHTFSIQHGTLSADGRRALTTSADYVARVWDTQTGKPMTPILQHQHSTTQGSFSPDGRKVIIPSLDGSAKVWQLEAQSPRGKLIHLTENLRPFALGPCGRLLSFRGPDTVVVSDPSTGKMLGTVHGAQKRGRFHGIGDPTLRGDGRYLVADDGKGHLRVWEVKTGKPIGRPIQNSEFHFDVSFDGRLVSTSWTTEHATIWDVATGEKHGSPLAQDYPVRFGSFAPGGKLMATCGLREPVIQLWDVATLQPVGKPITIPKNVSHGGNVQVTFSPDSRSLVIYNTPEQTARVYDVATRKPVGPLIKHRVPPLPHDQVRNVAFSRDARMLVTCGLLDRNVYVWETSTGQPISPPLRHTAQVQDVAFASDGRSVITLSNGELRLWDLSTDPRSADDLVKLAQVLHGHRLDQYGALVPLTPQEQDQVFRALKAKYGDDYLRPQPHP